MSYHFGLDKELAEKAKSKYDPIRESEARVWIESVTGESFASPSFNESLKNGILLCKLASKVSGSAVKFNSSAMPFKQMENINAFLGAMDKLKVPKNDQFQTIDLFEDKNPNQVVDSIFALSRHASKAGFAGPQLGPKLADKHVVEFTAEQISAGKTISPQQMGFTGGASQSGMSYGSRREIANSDVGFGSSEVSQQTQGSINGANASGIVYGGRREINGGGSHGNISSSRGGSKDALNK